MFIILEITSNKKMTIIIILQGLLITIYFYNLRIAKSLLIYNIFLRFSKKEVNIYERKTVSYGLSFTSHVLLIVTLKRFDLTLNNK